MNHLRFKRFSLVLLAVAAGCAAELPSNPDDEIVDSMTPTMPADASAKKDSAPVLPEAEVAAKVDAAAAAASSDGSRAPDGSALDGPPASIAPDAGSVIVADVQGGGNFPASGPPTGSPRIEYRTAFFPLKSCSGPLRLGADQNGSNGFPGDIDRIRFYNRVLTEAEIGAHYRHEYTPCNTDPGCVAEWTFESLVNGAFPSSGKASLPARLVGSTPLVPSPEGKAIRLSNKAYLEVANAPDLAFGRTLTFEIWAIRQATCPAGYSQPVKDGCRFMRYFDLGPAMTIDAHATSSRVIAYPNSAMHGNPWPPADKWAHLVIVFDVMQGISFHLNGKLTHAHRMSM